MTDPKIVFKIIIFAFFNNHITLRPAFVIPLRSCAFFPRKRPDIAWESASIWVPWVAPKGWMWRRLHGTRLHWRRLVSITSLLKDSAHSRLVVLVILMVMMVLIRFSPISKRFERDSRRIFCVVSIRKKIREIWELGLGLEGIWGGFVELGLGWGGMRERICSELGFGVFLVHRFRKKMKWFGGDPWSKKKIL